MYSLKVLAPILLSLCAEEFTSRQGDYCTFRQSKPSMVKYYEPGKSCYVNGVFYTKCEERNGSI